MTFGSGAEVRTPMFCQIECGGRRAKCEQVLMLGEYLYEDEKEMFFLIVDG